MPISPTPRPQAPETGVSSRLARHTVEVLNHTTGRKVLRPVADAVRTALALEQPHKPAYVCVVVCDGDEVRQANKGFRQVDETTDVLSFPAPPNPAGHLGDVMVAWPFAVAQAKLRKIKPVDEAAMLAVHGVLHLLGYDDHTDADRSTMLVRMNKVMAVAGLPEEPAWSSLPHGAVDGL